MISPTDSPAYSIHEATPSAKGIFDCAAWGMDASATCALRSIDLTDAQRGDLMAQINSAAVTRATNPDARKPASAENSAGEDVVTAPVAQARPRQTKMIVEVKYSCVSWDAFLSWIALMDEEMKSDGPVVAPANDMPIFRSRGPYDVMIDGANVGYYKQNYNGAPQHIDYFQVDAMLKYLQSTGRRVLLVLHCRHLHPAAVPSECVDVIRAWADDGVLLTAPAGSNDGML